MKIKKMVEVEIYIDDDNSKLCGASCIWHQEGGYLCDYNKVNSLFSHYLEEYRDRSRDCLQEFGNG